MLVLWIYLYGNMHKYNLNVYWHECQIEIGFLFIDEEFSLVVLDFIKFGNYDLMKALNWEIQICSSDIRIKVIGGIVEFN